MEALAVYLLVGVFAGLSAGMFGVGGGIVVVPALVIYFQRLGYSPEIVSHLAVGSSLATIVTTSAAAVRAHHRHGAVRWDILRRMLPGLAIGALAGILLATAISARGLAMAFGVFELIIAAHMAFGRPPAAHRRAPGTVGLNLGGGIIGTLSSLLGVGGGTMAVPWLAWCNLDLRVAIATAGAIGLPIAAAATAGFVIIGWGEPLLPVGSTGYVHWPAFLGISLSSMMVARHGAWLAHRLPVPILKRLFALVLALLGLRMLSG